MPGGGNGQKLPRAEEEAGFWARLESAWAERPREAGRARQALGVRGSGQAAGLPIIEAPCRCSWMP